MKHITHALLAFTCIYASAAVAADGDNYIPLNQIMVEDHNDEIVRPTRSFKDLYAEGVRTANQALDCSKRKLTTCVDLPNYAKTFGLATLVTMNVSSNDITHENLYTILKHVPKLTCLDASRNKRITCVKNMPAHDTLETLLLNDNGITELNIAHLCTQLAALRQLALQNNPLQAQGITNITGIYPSMEEFWLGDSEGLYQKQWDALIKTFPNIKAELTAGSRMIQKYYSKTEQQYYRCTECDTGDDAEGCFWINVIPPFMGGVVSIGTAFLASGGNDALFGKHLTIFGPIGLIAPSVCMAVLYRVNAYCSTPAHERYKTTHTREINMSPQLLDLVADDVEPESESGQEE